MPKQKATGELRLVPNHRYKWFEYVEEGAADDDIPYRLEVRTSLTFGELEDLVWESDAKDAELWQMFAPFVRDWNISALDEAGEVVAVEPPAIGGPEQFRFVPPQLFIAVIRDLKMRSTGPLARRPFGQPAGTADGSNDASTTS